MYLLSRQTVSFLDGRGHVNSSLYPYLTQRRHSVDVWRGKEEGIKEREGERQLVALLVESYKAKAV